VLEPPADSGALSVETVVDRGASYLRLSGVINERFEGAQLGKLGATAVLDLEGIVSITSFGVRKWCEFTQSIRAGTRLYLVHCAPCVVDQINLVMNFCGPDQVITLKTHYFCACGTGRLVVVDVLGQGALLRTGKIPLARCLSCGKHMQADEPSVFRAVSRYGAKSLDPQAGRLLSRLGVYQFDLERRPLEVKKLVEDRVTILKLEGMLDERFRPRRLAADLEGEVVVILSGLTIAEEAIARFNELLRELTADERRVVLVDLPAQLADLYEKGWIDLRSTIVYSVLHPCYCPRCDELSTQYARLSRLTAERRALANCPRCGGVPQLVAGVFPLERLRKEVKHTPTAAKRIIRRLGELFSVADVEATAGRGWGRQGGARSDRRLQAP
jgi:hypothetical protein